MDGRMRRKSGLLEHDKIMMDSTTLVLAKPLTFMNDSGRAIHSLTGMYRFDWQEMVVVYDDIDLKLGEVRVRARGSAGTHKGMKSVLAAAGTSEFPRIRIGIDQAGRTRDIIRYVLTPLSGEAWDLFQDAVARAAGAVQSIISNGIESTMNEYNRRANSLLPDSSGG
jgi:peptidyl-tRNA hydrolase, PTH1 family